MGYLPTSLGTGIAAWVQDRLSEKITPILDKLHQATEAANDRIDTRDIYRTITGQCRNW